MNDWQPIETAPKDRRILLYDTIIGTFTGCWTKGDNKFGRAGWFDDGGDFENPTHWMELPEKPGVPYKWPRIRDLPVEHREPFRKWVQNKIRPELEGVPDKEQDGYYSHDYKRWYRT